MVLRGKSCFAGSMVSPILGSHYQERLCEMNWEDNKGIKQIRLLRDCASFTESCNFINADIGLFDISHLASPDGASIQRVATYFSEALAYCQLVKNWRGVPKVLRLSKKLSTPEELLVRKLFFDLYPFLKVSYMTTNQAIIESMRGEKAINILDLSASDANQWIHLMQSLKEHLPNPTYMRITVTVIHEKKEVLEHMGLRLRLEAERLNFPFQFNPVVSTLENLDLETLPIKKEEPLAISCVLRLHSLLATDDETFKFRSSFAPSMNQRTYVQMLGKQKKKKKIGPSPDSALSPLPLSPPKMECFLSGLWKLHPRVMVIAEQEANVNKSILTKRVNNALNFYGSLFDCLQSTFSTTLLDRTLLEKMLLGEQIKNIVACEGVERKERYEKLKTWIPRLELAGFQRVPISSTGILQAKKLLQSYVNGYEIVQDNKCLFICWKGRRLFSVTAWRF